MYNRVTKFQYQNFVTRLYIHKFYCIYFHCRFFDYGSLIILIIEIKKSLICHFNAYLFVGFSLYGKTEYNFVYVFINYFCAIVTYCIIISNLLFLPLNIDKASEQHTHVTESLFSQQVPGLSNRCTFALANGLAGIFISRY